MLQTYDEHQGRIQTPPHYALDSINARGFDDELHAWACGARNFAHPLIVEFGTEVNGYWFPWNARYNGPHGAEKFRQAFTRIVWIARQAGASNITWVFHIAADDDPDSIGNHLEEYYPGDDWVDWIAVSVYGPQESDDHDWTPFRDRMQAVHERIRQCAPAKPIIVAELGARRNDEAKQSQWADAALASLIAGWHSVIGFAWWNSGSVDMRVQDNLELAKVFRQRLAHEQRILQRALEEPAVPKPAGTEPTSPPERQCKPPGSQRG